MSLRTAVGSFLRTDIGAAIDPGHRAVSLANGRVCFGKLELVKSAHWPKDEIVIGRDQAVYWKNLSKDGRFSQWMRDNMSK